jgi:hypothetical protein
MAEWSIAAVLKTVEVKASGGSNPSLSARFLGSCESQRKLGFFILGRILNQAAGLNEEFGQNEKHAAKRSAHDPKNLKPPPLRIMK